MAELKLYYATNRNHEGAYRWRPDAYGKKFSADGMENLRFGVVCVTADDKKIAAYLNKGISNCGTGDGQALSNYLTKCVKNSSTIVAFKENLKKEISEAGQKDVKLGSQTMFSELMDVMRNNSDILVYIHGFNVTWQAAVGSALALQKMLDNSPKKDSSQSVTVVLFTWPSDGLALPWVSYKSDRAEAAGSGAAVGRAFLKLRDFLAQLHDKVKGGGQVACEQNIHLLCHSMGNFLLQNALIKTWDHTPGSALPRIFEHIFLCAPDVDDNALESEQPMARVNQLGRNVTIYHNRNDKALVVSDHTKGNPDRLGGSGVAHPALLHNKVHQVDCTPVINDFIGHSYYLVGNINADIRASIDGYPQEDQQRQRKINNKLSNLWEMKA